MMVLHHLPFIILNRGTTADSEPETRAVKVKPQILISYHSYSQLVLYPWAYPDETSDDDTDLNTIAVQMAAKIKEINGIDYTPQKSSELYNTNGDVTDWSYGELGIFSFTVELRPKGYPYFELPTEEILPTFKENYNVVQYIISKAQEIFVAE